MTSTQRDLDRILAKFDQAERDLYAWVDDVRAAGWTWQQVGDAVGVSRQAAWKRWGDVS